jgi:O-antigen ligase
MYIVGTKNNSCPATPVVYASLAAILVTVATSFNFDLRSALVDGEMLVSNNRRYLGYFVMVASIATSTYILLSSEDRKYYILSGLTFAFLVWIGGRGAVIAFTSTMLLLIALLVYLKQLKIRLLFFLLISLFIGCLLSIPLNIYHWNGLIRFVSDNEGLMGLQSSSSLARLELWSESIELFLAKPLLGYGPEAHHFNTQIGYLQPHNFILQWLVEFGLLGTMCLLYLIYSILIKALKQSLVSTTAINKVSLFCAIGLLIQALVDGNLYHGAPTALFVLLCVSASVNIHLPPHVERNNKNVTSSFTSVKE